MSSIVAGITLAVANFIVGLLCLFRATKSSFNGFISIVFGGMVARLGVSSLLVMALLVTKTFETIPFAFALVLSYPLLLIVEIIYAVRYLDQMKKKETL